jgi:integrase
MESGRPGEGGLTVEESKTEAGEGRVIDLTPMLLEELKLHHAEHPHAKPDDLVFPMRKARQRDRSNSRGRLSTILKRANAKRAKRELQHIAHVMDHTLRRTFASLMYEADAQPTDVMAAMGHKSAKLALEVYGPRPRDGEAHGCARRLGTNGLKRQRTPPHRCRTGHP